MCLACQLLDGGTLELGEREASAGRVRYSILHMKSAMSCSLRVGLGVLNAAEMADVGAEERCVVVERARWLLPDA